jgi:short chain dehydrogenase
MFRTQRPLRLARRNACDIASFMQFFSVNFLNECAFVLCAAITQRDSGFRAMLPRMTPTFVSKQRRSPSMKSSNSANWILVTGTSTGIGRAATVTLAENGYRILAAVRKQQDIESLLTEAGTRRVGGSAEPILLDVTDAGQIAAAVEIVRTTIAAGGRLHAIVNNAGAQWAGPIETMPLTEWRSQFDVLLFGPIALIQQLLPQLRAWHGRVINVTKSCASIMRI